MNYTSEYKGFSHHGPGRELFGRRARAWRCPIRDRQAHQPPGRPDARAAVRALDAQAVADGNRRALLPALPDHRRRRRGRHQRRRVSATDRIEGQLRIKCPTTLAILNFGEILNDFQVAHPGIAIDLVLIDRSVNPVEEDFDIAIGAMPASYANVIDEPLSPYPRVLCAAPAYIDARGRTETSDRPDRPRLPDLPDHRFDLVVRKPARADQRRRALALLRQRQPDPAERRLPRPRHRHGGALHRPAGDRSRPAANLAAGLSGAGAVAEGADSDQQDPPCRGAKPADVDQAAHAAAAVLGGVNASRTKADRMRTCPSCGRRRMA